MARSTQPLPRTRSITTTITTIITLFIVATLPALSQSQEVPQGCNLHPQEKLVSCRSVNTSLLQDFLHQVIPVTTITPQDTIITTTATPDNSTSTTNISTPHPHTTAESESEDEASEQRSNSSNTPSWESSEITELECVGCGVPKLTPPLFGPLATLERLTIVDSGLEEILPDALASHALTLVHLDLSYNLLQSVPGEVVKLTRLQILDLRHNGIHHVAEGTVLSSMRTLRYLYLDHNQLGQTLSSSQDQRSRKSVFDLWAAAEDTRPLPRLSHLGLSFNALKEVPSGAFTDLANLLHLDLSHNLLTSLRQSDLPSSLLNLDLGGNPWSCTCETAWILQQQSNPLPSITITSPTCFSPLHLHHHHLDSLSASEVCLPEDDLSSSQEDQVVHIGDDVQGPLRDAFRAVRLLNATALTTHALLISWRVDAAFYSLGTPPLQPLSWAVTVRNMTQDSSEAQVTHLRLERYRKEQPHWTPGDGLFAEVLGGLSADTAYVICLTVVQGHRLYTRQGHCLQSITLSTLSVPPPSVPSAATAPEALQSYSTQDYDIHTEAFTVWSEPHSASLSWNVTILPRESGARFLVPHESQLLRPLGWRVSYRQDGEEDKETNVVLVSRGGEPLQNFTNRYSIEGLQAGSKYVFCLHTLTDEELMEALAGSNSKRPQHDMSPLQPLPWEAHSHTLPTTAQVVDSRRGGGHQEFETNTGNLPPPLPSQPASPTHTTLPPPESKPPFSAPSMPSSHSFQPHPPSTSSSSTFPSTSPDLPPAPPNLPPAPPNLPPSPPSLPPSPPNLSSSPPNFPPGPPSLPPGPPSLPPGPPSFPPISNTRPPRPSQPPSSGGFVYTSSGKRIPLPSGPSGLVPPFGVPPPIPVRDPGPRRGVPSPPASSRPSRQRFIYEFEETSPAPPSPSPSSSPRTQIYTYQTRRRRAVEGRRVSSFKTTPLCRQVVTPAELDVVLPATIAATISCATTVVVVLLVCCCCWPRRCCRRKSAWRSRSTHDLRKVSTISAPSPVTVFSGHTSVMAGTGTARNNGSAATSREELPADSDRAARSISMTSSSGYLTPLSIPNGHDPQSQNPDPKVAYLSLMQSRLLQKHKDMPDFHPGYDIPPTASNKTLVGYDYPHPTPVDPTNGGGRKSRTLSTSPPPQLPSPSSSDSNFNVSIGNTPEPNRNPAEVNLNIPFQQLKSSGLTKSVHVPPRDSDNSNYIYTGEETPTSTPVRTYLKHPPPSKARHRKFGQAQQGGQEQGSMLQSLSRSTPDLATATAGTTQTGSESPPGQPVSLPHATTAVETSGYINFPAVQRDTDVSNQQKQPANGNSSSSKEREPFHTWAGHSTKARPGVGEVVLSGGTLIEVPEGYVVPNAPKPTPFIRLLVRGQDESKDNTLQATSLPPSVHEENGDEGAGVTRLAPKTDNNRLVINTAVAL
ncbi:uncharacterized protein LOC135089865 [Scylla paramamosain]|uniref:uncharacterized protein LOC135089865 n=1 Tax=Scylla paramamosain TaxID=85552 RepID=UPI003082CC4D